MKGLGVKKEGKASSRRIVQKWPHKMGREIENTAIATIENGKMASCIQNQWNETLYEQ